MTTKIKIGIVGSRKYTDKRRIKDLIFEIKEKYGDGVEIVSGGQRDGADGFAKKYYVSNYFKRNKQIAEYSNIIVAFIPEGLESRGTMDTIRHAEKLKKLVKIIN